MQVPVGGPLLKASMELRKSGLEQRKSGFRRVSTMIILFFLLAVTLFLAILFLQ
jgi:hypothetical protein